MGVLVPPKPEEPDNCCMSGCVNCVWDTFREEMELWADANREVARRKVFEKRKREKEAAEAGGGREKNEGLIDELQGRSVGQLQQQSRNVGAASMDDGGGGSETNWDELGNPAAPGNLWDDNLYRNVPVGIREFMKLEKRLRASENSR